MKTTVFAIALACPLTLACSGTETDQRSHAGTQPDGGIDLFGALSTSPSTSTGVTTSTTTASSTTTSTMTATATATSTDTKVPLCSCSVAMDLSAAGALCVTLWDAEPHPLPPHQLIWVCNSDAPRVTFENPSGGDCYKQFNKKIVAYDDLPFVYEQPDYAPTAGAKGGTEIWTTPDPIYGITTGCSAVK